MTTKTAGAPRRKPKVEPTSGGSTYAVILAIYRKPNMFYRDPGKVMSGYDT